MIKRGMFSGLLVLLGLTSATGQVVVTPTPVSGYPGGYPGTGIPVGATIPRVVSSTPANGQKNVNSNTRQITIKFDQPMDVATFYWPIPQGQADFPLLSADPYWTNGNTTIVLPVRLNINTLYRIPLNTTSQVFRSAQGVALQPGIISFITGTSSSGGTGMRPGSTSGGGWSGQPQLTPRSNPWGASSSSGSSAGGLTTRGRSSAPSAGRATTRGTATPGAGSSSGGLGTISGTGGSAPGTGGGLGAPRRATPRPTRTP